MRTRDPEPLAVAWALDEVEAELRREPAHRLVDPQREYAWSLTAPNGVGVYVEAVRSADVGPTAAEFELLASAGGLLKRVLEDRRVALPLHGDAARVPDSLYLVFERNGKAYAFETLEEAGDVLDVLDLIEDRFAGAFSDQGEKLVMYPAAQQIEFRSSQILDPAALQVLIRGSEAFSDPAENSHYFALRVWRST